MALPTIRSCVCLSVLVISLDLPILAYVVTFFAFLFFSALLFSVYVACTLAF